MDESVVADNILDKIDRFENSFTINDDSQLTQEVKGIISLTPWDRIAGDNRKVLRSKLGFYGDIGIQDDFGEVYIRGIKELNKSKNVAMIFPENTRFRFIKKCLFRITRAAMIPQQIFNNELTSLLDSFYWEIVRLQAENAEIK
jgi:hypothetical protein